MKNVRTRIAIIIAWIAAIVAIAFMLQVYSTTVSTRLYDEAKRNFSEVYQQVDSNFLAFMDDTWKNLSDWGPYVHDLDDTSTAAYIEERRGVWGFSRFLFLNQNGQAIALNGDGLDVNLGDDSTLLFGAKDPIMAEQGLESTTPETIFATPIAPGTYRGFDYQAIAVTYTNEDLANTIETDAFGNQAIGFVIYPDGTIAFSTQEGGNVFSNYLTYLSAGSNLTDQQLAGLKAAWEEGRKGVELCSLAGTEYYISYQPLGYNDYVLLGVVPSDAVSGAVRNVQEMTVDTLVKVFFIIIAVAAVQVFLYIRNHMKKSKAEIEYRDVLFDVLSENLDDIFVVIDADTHKVSYITPNVERLLGVSAEAAKEDLQTLREGIVDKDAAINLDSLRSEQLGKRQELVQEWINQQDGTHRWFREAIYHMNIQGEEMYIFILSDRTDDRKMAQNLEEALATAKNANKAKSEFLSNMSHDIRTPMNAIMGFTALLEENADDPVRVREYIHKISASSRHLLSLINDVLDMSKIESGKTELSIEEFSLADLLDEVGTIMASQAQAKDQAFDLRIEGHPSEHLMGDKLRINQILINLLSNAVKYTPVGGKIEFIIKELPNKNPHFNNLRFIVRDNGMGMSEEYLKVIFDPFTRETSSVVNAIQGTGLGMAITKNIVDLMGGIISVDSELGIGTTFSVDLRFAVADGDGRKHYWKARPEFKMFVVDDDIDVCKSIEVTMKAEGVPIQYATDGVAAVEAIKAAHEQGQSYDVILVDWKMPGQSGVETARQIREIVGDESLVLVLTAFDWSKIEHEAIAAGIDDFMSKPFFATAFSRKLELLTGEAPEDAEPDIDPDVLRGLNILAAEDNEMSAEMLIERLDIEGAKVTRARNGQEALELFEQSQPGEYDLILMDVQMPIMGGHDATRAIRASSHPEATTIPIFAMTANVFAEDVKACLDAGMDEHIPKPIPMEELKAAVDKRLGKRL